MSPGSLSDWVQVVVAIVACGVSGVAFYIARRGEKTAGDLATLQRIHALSDRLYDIDRLFMDHPEVLMLMREQAGRKEPYFTPATVHDERYYRVKTAIYMQLNYYDELVSTVRGDKALQKLIEFGRWKVYMLQKMRHPLFQELFDREKQIWGHEFAHLVEADRRTGVKPVDMEIF